MRGMHKRNLYALVALVAALAACAAKAPVQPAAAPPRAEAVQGPPVAKVDPHRFEEFGHVRIDDYYWLKERSNPDVMAYLKAENDYLSAAMKHTEAFQERLYNEITGRLKQDDSSVPYKLDDYYYYTRFVEGGNYPVYCRKRGTLDAAEQVMLDANALSNGHGYFSVTGVEVSSGQDIMAYATDTVGRRFYTVRFKNLSTGEVLPDVLSDVSGNVAWANDNRTVFYTKQDPETLRWYRIYRHVLGSDPANDPLVYEEKDETFSCAAFKTKSKRFIMISCWHTLANEYRYVDADKPEDEFKVFLPRERGHEYSVDHYGDRFYIRTNYHAKNFRLMSTPVSATGRENWKEVIPHRDDVYLEDMEIFRDYLVVSEWKGALTHLRVIPWAGGGEHYIDFGEPAYAAFIARNPVFDTTTLRYVYTSMTTPSSTYDYDMATRARTLMKRDEVLGGFDPANYVTERLWATARDGVKVPISIVYRKSFVKDGRAPLLLYGYGSYGASMSAYFDVARLSLLDRGFAYAVAHIRGGQELGRDWYDNGKLLHKKNTFTDFIDCAEYLVKERYTSPDRLFAHGGSAGGLLMGAVTNMRPDLFKGVVSQVPYVDVITTMLDPSIPLTTAEYDEWGDPNKKEYYEYMLSYSPYDNVERKAYPNMLITTGLHDSQVQYWEPAKYVAKLRAMKTDQNRLLLYTNMEAGHGGTSGRLRHYRDTALVHAFVLDLMGITQ
ncbi:MAG: S9 family peptidase [Acidobacteriota bacterium]